MFYKSTVLPFHHVGNFQTDSLFVRYVNDFDAVQKYYQYDYRKLQVVIDQAGAHQISARSREELVRLLRDYNLDVNDSPATRKHLEYLQSDQCFTVCTGQQSALFLGPLYTVYKAMTAILLAQKLQSMGGLKVVPVFWVASDDHDLDEVDHITLLNRESQFRKIRASLSGCKGSPVYDSEFSVCDALQALFQELPVTEFTGTVLRLIPKDEKNIARSFAKMLASLFQEYGLLLVEPRVVRSLFRGVNVQYYSHHEAVAQAFYEQSQSLRIQGYQPSVECTEAFRLFYLHEGQRKRLYSGNTHYSTKDHSLRISSDTLERQLDKNPELFSPDVVLRPLYQDAVFPNIAYVAGPNEVAYFAQLRWLYELFKRPMPLIYPRASVSIIEKKHQRILERYNINLKQVFQMEYPDEAEYPQKPEHLAVLQDFHHALEDALTLIERKARELGPAVTESISPSLRKIRVESRTIHHKYLKRADDMHTRSRAHIEALKNSITPKSQLQERVFNIVPYLNLYGLALIPKLMQALSIEQFSHQVLYYE